MLAELLKRVGEPYDEERHLADFGLEQADYVADFYNNGGLEFHNNGVNYALQYASVTGGYASATEGRVEIGAWAWFDGEDFDTDATFETYEEDDFSAGELKRIADRIKAIYG